MFGFGNSSEDSFFSPQKAFSLSKARYFSECPILDEFKSSLRKAIDWSSTCRSTGSGWPSLPLLAKLKRAGSRNDRFAP